jgi:predicted transcriptional regulator
MKTITITLDDDIADRLTERAKLQGGRSVSSLIREACAEKLDRDTTPEPQPEEATA